MVQFALFLVRLFKKPIRWLGVDYHQFEILLRTKLIIDFRGTSSAFQSPGSKKQTFRTQFFIYTLYGLLFAAASFSIKDIMLSLTIFFSVMMVTLTMNLLSEFTTVLFDHRDNSILLPRPVNSRTLLMVRLTHIQFYMSYIALALSLASCVMLVIKYKLITGLIYILVLGLCSWLTLIFTTFIYLMISKTVEGERFKDIITYIQILIAIIVFAGYQLLPRLIDYDVLTTATMTLQWWNYLFPPAWFAALVKITLFTDNTTMSFILSLLAVIIPVTGAMLLIRYLSKGFGNVLGEGSSESVTPLNHRTTKWEKNNRLKRFFCLSDLETAGWNLAMATTKRDRKFKQSVYPYFGIMIVFAVIIFKPDLNNLSVSLQEMRELSKYFFIVIVGFSGSIAVSQLPYTDTPEAAWIYQSLPLRNHGHLLTGAVKAMLFRFFLPVYLLVTILSIFLWGYLIFPQVVLGAMGIILLIMITVMIQKMGLPFTQIREMQQKGINTITAILNMILLGLLAGLVYLTSFISGWITLLISGFFAGLIILIFRAIRERSYVTI
jgi:ABC-2 type transport system permease protein